jgi:hypothetical protein
MRLKRRFPRTAPRLRPQQRILLRTLLTCPQPETQRLRPEQRPLLRTLLSCPQTVTQRLRPTSMCPRLEQRLLPRTRLLTLSRRFLRLSMLRQSLPFMLLSPIRLLTRRRRLLHTCQWHHPMGQMKLSSWPPSKLVSLLRPRLLSPRPRSCTRPSRLFLSPRRGQLPQLLLQTRLHPML